MGASSFRRNADDAMRAYTPGAKRYRGSAASATDILKALLKRNGLDVQMARYQFVSHWEELVGKQIAERAKPDCIKGKTLVIKVKNSSWAQELSFHKQVILARVNKFFTPDEMLKEIRFVVGNF